MLHATWCFIRTIFAHTDHRFAPEENHQWETLQVSWCAWNLKIAQIWNPENHLKLNLHDFGFQPLVFHSVWSDDGRSPTSSSRSPCSRVMWSPFRRPTSATHRWCRILKEPLPEGRSRVSSHSWLRKNVQGSRACVWSFSSKSEFPAFFGRLPSILTFSDNTAP